MEKTKPELEEHNNRIETVAKNRGKIQTDENVLYIIGWILLVAVVAFLIVWQIWGDVLKEKVPPCLFHLLTGFYCPGCGGTRAMFALVKGKLLTSLVYHPFVPYSVVIGGWFLISQTIERVSKGRVSIGMKYRDIYLWIALALVLINFVVKNVLVYAGIDILR